MKEHEGARLERWLIEQGISKSQLAEKLGIYLSGISYVLSREKIPVKHRAKLKALGFDIEAEHQNPNSDGYKLKQFIDSNNLKVKDVAEKLGKAPQYITNLYTSQRFSSSLLELLHKIGFDLKAYPNSPPALNLMESNAGYGPSHTQRARVVHAQAFGGYLRGHNDDNFLQTLPEHFIYIDEPGLYRTFEVKGDSMEPDFPSGCLVDAKNLEPTLWKKLIKGRVFVFAHDEMGLQVKLLVKQKENICTFRSINEYYPDFEVDLNQVRELWYFVQKHDTNRDYSRYLVR